MGLAQRALTQLAYCRAQRALTEQFYDDVKGICIIILLSLPAATNQLLNHGQADFESGAEKNKHLRNLHVVQEPAENNLVTNGLPHQSLQRLSRMACLIEAYNNYLITGPGIPFY